VGEAERKEGELQVGREQFLKCSNRSSFREPVDHS